MNPLQFGFLASAFVASTCHAESPLYSIPLKNIEGQPVKLKQYEGKVLLIVNVASKCGFTPQYDGLEALWKEYRDRGLVVLGFPCNQFGAQEPGSEEEIRQFCTSKFKVTFPMFSKVNVNAPDQHPLYEALTTKDSPAAGPIKWNFSKILVGKDGKIISRFDSAVDPNSEQLKTAITGALAAK